MKSSRELRDTPCPEAGPNERCRCGAPPLCGGNQKSRTDLVVSPGAGIGDHSTRALSGQRAVAHTERELVHDYRSTRSANPIHLYRDVLVAIDETSKVGHRLAQPVGAPVRCPRYQGEGTHRADRLRPRILFTAILSELVGPQGTVVAIDCESQFVERARSNLRDRSNVAVIHGDGCQDVAGSADVVIVHAGFTHPHPLWINSLRRNGRLLVPLTRRSRQGTVVRITRLRSGYRAEAVRGIRIFPCNGRGNSALDGRLTDWWETASALAPLRFHRIDHGLPSNGKPRPPR